MDRGKRVYLIRVYSKEFSLKLQKILEIKPGRKSHIVRIPRGLSIDELKSFIAGLIDGDGSVGCVSTGIKNGKYGPYVIPRIVISSKSRHLILDLIHVLKDFGFKNIRFTYNEGVYRLVLYSMYNMCLLIKEIAPFMLHPDKIAGAMAWANSCREMSG